MENKKAGHGKGLELAVPAIIFLGALGLFALQWFYGPSFLGILGDVAATAADRVRAGDVPYRDFWTMYAPGSYYLLALLFGVFGDHILVSTVAGSILSAAAVVQCFRLVHKVTDGMAPALACAGIFFAAIYSTGYYLSLGPYPPAIFCILTALNFSADFHKGGARTRIFAAGLMTGLAIVFKHDVGGYAAIAITFGLAAGHFGKAPASGVSNLVSKIAIFAAGVAAAAAPVAIYFAVLAGPEMWRDLIVFPATDFRYTRPENYPGLWPSGILDDWWLKSVFNFLNYLRFTVPFLVVLTAVATLVFAAAKNDRKLLPMGVTLAVLYVFHYSSAHVQINTNIMSLPLYAAMLGAVGYRIVKERIRESRRMLLGLLALLAAGVGFVAFILQPVYQRVRNDQQFVTTNLPRLTGLKVSPEENDTMTRLSGFINENVPPGDRIFIGLHRHDTTVIGDGWTYFILGRLNATSQDQLHPGIVDTSRVQKEMIRDLRSKDVEYILLKQNVFSDEVLDELRKAWSVTLPESGSTELDEYIRANYRKTITIGQYEIWKKSEKDQTARGEPSGMVQPVALL